MPKINTSKEFQINSTSCAVTNNVLKSAKLFLNTFKELQYLR